MQVIGAIMAVIGFLISLTGIGFLLGFPMIIIGLVALIAPKFSYLALISAVISYEIGVKSMGQYLTVCLTLLIILILIHLGIAHWIKSKAGK